MEICRQILKHGNERCDRTGVGTLSIFSPPVVKYSLRDGKIPCFTTKKIAVKQTIEELLWFISGSTDSKILEAKGINWWKGNTSRAFLDNLGLDYPEGQLGPLYGWQWRRSGAVYNPGHPDHGQGGVDQLGDLIKEIRTNPTSRRLIVSTYVPADIKKAVLPPCHSFFQFYVNGNELDCILYQRSADMFLGAQINVLSYSILTHMIAKITGLKPGDFYHHIGDGHIYKNHVEQMKVQLSREILEPPRLFLKDVKEIDDFVIDDFEIKDYKPWPAIKAPMAV